MTTTRHNQSLYRRFKRIPLFQPACSFEEGFCASRAARGISALLARGLFNDGTVKHCPIARDDWCGGAFFTDTDTAAAGDRPVPGKLVSWAGGLVGDTRVAGGAGTN